MDSSSEFSECQAQANVTEACAEAGSNRGSTGEASHRKAGMDSDSTPRRLSPRWIAFLALLVLGAGLGIASRQWRPPAGPSPAGILAPADTAGDPIPRALKQASGADEKSRWVDDLPELDLASLDPARREIFLRAANSRRCTCDCGYTLAACRIFDSSCEKSLPRVRALFDSVAHGLLADAAGLRERPATP
jgi:hypothetical protein